LKLTQKLHPHILPHTQNVTKW